MVVSFSTSSNDAVVQPGLLRQALGFISLDLVGVALSFEIDAFRKHCLLNGLDDIGLTLQDADAIASFEARYRQSSPWMFPSA